MSGLDLRDRSTWSRHRCCWIVTDDLDACGKPASHIRGGWGLCDEHVKPFDDDSLEPYRDTIRRNSRPGDA